MRKIFPEVLLVINFARKFLAKNKGRKTKWPTERAQAELIHIEPIRRTISVGPYTSLSKSRQRQAGDYCPEDCAKDDAGPPGVPVRGSEPGRHEHERQQNADTIRG